MITIELISRNAILKQNFKRKKCLQISAYLNIESNVGCQIRRKVTIDNQLLLLIFLSGIDNMTTDLSSPDES